MSIDLARIADTLPDRRVAVIGDALLDVYLQGRVERLCREAPVPLVQIDSAHDVPGGAANAATNLAALGARVTFVSAIGDDLEGARLRRALRERGVDDACLLADGTRRTPAKHRVVADGQMVARYDAGARRAVPADIEHALLDRALAACADADVVVLSDYGYGIFTAAVLEALAGLGRRLDVPVVVDSRRLTRFAVVAPTVVKPSYSQAFALLERPGDASLGGRAERIAAQSEHLLARTGARIAAVTLDTDGAVILEHGRPPYRTYARPAHAQRSTGSGDTYVAALALALGSGAETPEAAEIAAAAAAVVVGKDGTAVCSTAELRALFAGGEKRVPDARALAQRVEAERAIGRRIVFTNGCFDILHRGHVTLLNRAKGLGDVLIVGVNADASVARLKGRDRPINALEDRLKVLSALSYVDYVVGFDEDSPRELIRAARPDIYVKGGDYTRDTLPEAALVESLGGAVCILPYVGDRSTSGIIERIRRAVGT